MSKAREVLAALKRGGWVETRRNGSYRRLRRVMSRRTALHSGSNHARVNAYSAHLGQIFKGWLTSVDTTGYSNAALITQLDEAAAEWFPRAFANGRHLAYPTRRPSAAGQEILAAKILSNRQFLQFSLGPDMDACFAKWRHFNGEKPTILSDALRASFLARVGMHGGAIWPVTEAGYRAGVQQARTDLAIRMTGSLAAEQGDDDDKEDMSYAEDEALATALGLTVVELLQLIGRGRQQTAIHSPQPGTGDQLTPSPSVLDAAGVRVGTAFEAEDDVDTCDPCAANARGGDDGDGIYWVESECPLPGEDCDALSRCRCVLSTVTDLAEG
jgi:predicted RNA binding protein YcfA (HicA-like mRNA interferase family)